MKTAALITAVVGTASVALADGVTSAIAPSASPPSGCSASYDGTFEITVAKVSGAEKRDAPIARRDSCSTDGILVATLNSGILSDAQARTGYIASNYQFQFDGPPQAGALYTSGFSACGNGSLALGGSAVFYECDSGDFYNLYDRSWAAQCSPVEIIILPCGGTASQAGDGQVVGTQIITTTIVSALGDGQPQVKTTTTGIPLCQVSQIADGQAQVGTTPCASITTSAAPTSSLAPVSQYSDGQIQVTPAASVPTVTSVAPVTETLPATSAPAGAPSGSVVTLPTETGAGSASASASASAGSSTLATSTASGSAGGSSSAAPSGTSSAPSSGTSAPAQSGAATGSVNMMGAAAALMVGLIGAVAFL